MFTLSRKADNLYFYGMEKTVNAKMVTRQKNDADDHWQKRLLFWQIQGVAKHLVNFGSLYVSHF